MSTNDIWLPMRVAEAMDEPDQPVTRILDAAAVVRGGGALGGWAAAYRRGVRMLDGRRLGKDLPVLLHTRPGHQVRSRPGMTPTWCQLFRGEVEWYEGDDVAILDRALYDEMRLAPNLTGAVVVVDMGVSRLTGDAHTSIDSPASDLVVRWRAVLASSRWSHCRASSGGSTDRCSIATADSSASPT